MANNNANSTHKVKVCLGHTRPVPHINYSYISDDSHWFVSSCLDGKPMLRNGETSEWVGTFEGHKGAVWMTSFNKPATMLATASADFSAKVWNAITGECLHTWHHDHCVKSIDWCDDETKVLTGCQDKKVRLFDANRPESDPVILPEDHAKAVKSSFILQDGTMAFCADENELRLWDLRSLQVTHRQPVEDLKCMDFNKYNNTLIIGRKDSVQMFSPKDLSLLHSVRIPGDISPEAAALSHDAKLLAVGVGLKVHEYDMLTGQELHSHKGHHGPVFSIRYCPTSLTYTSGSEDGLVRVWPSHLTLSKTEA